MDFLDVRGKKFMIFGVANRKSVAFHIAETLRGNGAETVFSVLLEEHAAFCAKRFPAAAVHLCDLSKESDIAELAEKMKEAGEELDGIVHSVAFANFADGAKPFHDTKKEDFLHSVDVSCYSLINIAREFRPILRQNSSIVTISISTTGMAAQSYGYMAPVKAALDSSVKFLAKSLGGANGVRVNAVGASLLKTSSSAGIPGYVEPYIFAEKATIRKKALETQEAADVAAFLLSPKSSGINAQTLVVDAGMSVNYFDDEIVKPTVNAATGIERRAKAP
jgi:enoyl-[acyl-carrier protein] reductase I